MQAHRFVRDIEADRLPREVFIRYLIYEADFVESAVLIFGHALVRAPGLAERRVLVDVQHGLAEKQLPYFQTTFRQMQITPPPRARFPADVEASATGCWRWPKTAATGRSSPRCLPPSGCMHTWCGRAAAGPISDPQLRRWVRLHTEEPFLQGVAWLQEQVDAQAQVIDATSCDAMIGCFARTLMLEIGFHTAPYAAVA